MKQILKQNSVQAVGNIWISRYAIKHRIISIGEEMSPKKKKQSPSANIEILREQVQLAKAEKKLELALEKANEQINKLVVSRCQDEMIVNSWKMIRYILNSFRICRSRSWNWNRPWREFKAPSRVRPLQKSNQSIQSINLIQSMWSMNKNLIYYQKIAVNQSLNMMTIEKK